MTYQVGGGAGGPQLGLGGSSPGSGGPTRVGVVQPG